MTCIRTNDAAPVELTEAPIAADYVASTEDHYQPQTAHAHGLRWSKKFAMASNEQSTNRVCSWCKDEPAPLCASEFQCAAWARRRLPAQRCSLTNAAISSSPGFHPSVPSTSSRGTGSSSL